MIEIFYRNKTKKPCIAKATEGFFVAIYGKRVKQKNSQNHPYPFQLIFREFYDRGFFQKQGEKALHSQSYGRLSSRRLWEKDQTEKPAKSAERGIYPSDMKTPVLKIQGWQRSFVPHHDEALFEVILPRHLDRLKGAWPSRKTGVFKLNRYRRGLYASTRGYLDNV